MCIFFSDHVEVVLLLLDKDADYKSEDVEGNYFISCTSDRKIFKQYFDRVNANNNKKGHPVDTEFLRKVLDTVKLKGYMFEVTDRLNAAQLLMQP